jgi:hypothetical protein
MVASMSDAGGYAVVPPLLVLAMVRARERAESVRFERKREQGASWRLKACSGLTGRAIADIRPPQAAAAHGRSATMAQPRWPSEPDRTLDSMIWR